jgi:hypothetical protein
MNASDVVHRRLHRQKLAWGRANEPQEVVAWFGAMQGQDYAAAKWAVGLRCVNATLAMVEQEVVERKIVRTWLMRGTLHLVAVPDVRWMLALLAPRLLAASAGRRRQLELDEATLARSHDVFAGALQGGQRLLRAEMKSALERAGIALDSSRLYHLLHWAGLQGWICFGPVQDKEETFVLFEEWVPAGEELTRDEALAELALRYVQSHGPATAQDFAWWSGLTLTDARAGLALTSSSLLQETMGGHRYWMLPDDPTVEAPSPTAHLLPPYDEYYVGYKLRDLILDPQSEKRAISNNGVFRPMVVIDGQVVGIWKQSARQNTVVLALETFRSLTKAETQALSAAAHRYGAFIHLPVDLLQ